MNPHSLRVVFPMMMLAAATLACMGGSETPAAPPTATTAGPTSETPPTATLGPTATASAGEVPPGLSTASTAPAGVMGLWGQHVALALDEEGNPFIAYAHVDLNGDGTHEDSKVYVVRWEADAGRWSAPTLVADTTGMNVYLNSYQLSLAHDASTNTLGLLYADQGGQALMLALSTDDGQSWQTEPVVITEGYHVFGGPSLLMANGQIHLAVADNRAENGQHIVYATRTATDATWSIQTAPTLAGLNIRWAQPALALDAAGQPGLAYWQKPAEGDTWTVAFWRPGTAEAFAALDSANTPNEAPFVMLAFMDTKAVVVANVRRGAGTETEVVGSMWAATSTDGQNWSGPTRLPDENVEYVELASLAANAERIALVAHGYNNFETVCGSLRTADSGDGQNWSVCAPQLDPEKRYATAFERGVLGPKGQLYVAFLTTAENGVGQILFWREP